MVVKFCALQFSLVGNLSRHVMYVNAHDSGLLLDRGTSTCMCLPEQAIRDCFPKLGISCRRYRPSRVSSKCIRVCERSFHEFLLSQHDKITYQD